MSSARCLVRIVPVGEPRIDHAANTHQREGTTTFSTDLNVGQAYRIHAVAGTSLIFKYEFGNIQGDCSGRATCNAVMGTNGANVVVNFHSCLGRC